MKHRREPLIRVSRFLAVLLSIGGIGIGLLWFVRGGPVGLLNGLLCLALGIGVGVGFWMLAALFEAFREIRRQLSAISRELAETQTPLMPADDEWPLDNTAADPADPSADVNPVMEMLESLHRQVRQLNDQVLLSEDQREVLRRERYSQRADELAGQIDQAVDRGDYDQAADLLDELGEAFDDDDRLDLYRRQIELGRRRQVRQLINGQVQQATDLMSVTRFDEAIRLAEKLQQSYPDAPEAGDLLSRVKREADTFRTEQRKRLFAIIQEHAEARQWTAALKAAHKLLADYPQSEQADHVRRQMSTLVDNARIQEVRDYRASFLDLLQRRRYGEAVELADYVVEHYPETAAAGELRDQLPRLRELAETNRS